MVLINQDTVDTIVLVEYYKLSRGRQTRYGKQYLIGAFDPEIPQQMIELAVEANLSRGFIKQNNFGNHEAFEISRSGIREIQSYLAQQFTDVQFIYENGYKKFLKRVKNGEKRYPQQLIPGLKDPGSRWNRIAKFIGISERALNFIASIIGIAPLILIMWNLIFR